MMVRRLRQPVTRAVVLVMLALTFSGHVRAAPDIPDFWGTREHPAKPDLSKLKRLRFLTTTDFPPFNYLDADGHIAGFNVDLARALCKALSLREGCQIEAMPWQELDGALERGGGEAIIAGIAITAQSRQRYLFSRSYMQFPARFVVRDDKAAAEPLYDALKGKRIGVMDGGGHEALLRDLFPDVKVVVYTHRDWMLDDLREEETDAVFGDGMRLSFWIAGADSQDCCTFAGGPYLAPEYLGQGMAIAVSPDNRDLADALDYALQEITLDGTFAELYLRYFPVSFY